MGRCCGDVVVLVAAEPEQEAEPDPSDRTEDAKESVEENAKEILFGEDDGKLFAAGRGGDILTASSHS
jgi:hypothetical protein